MKVRYVSQDDNGVFITTVTVCVLAQALHPGVALKSLDLRDNNLTPVGQEALRAAVGELCVELELTPDSDDLESAESSEWATTDDSTDDGGEEEAMSLHPK